MQNLLQLIIRYGVFLVFLLLEIICLRLVVSYNKSQKEIYLNSSKLLSAWVYQKTDKVVSYINISAKADSLAIENARLRTALDKAKYERLGSIDSIFDSENQQEYTYLPAKVINNSVQLWDNKLTLNRGSSHGVNRGMGIINDKGIVGIINNTSTNFSQALSLLHSQLRISATHKKSGHFGTLVWTENDPQFITLRDIHISAEVAIGDTIVTNRYSSVFPNGLLVGTIDDFVVERGTKIYKIKVKISQNLSKLDYVYIVNYLNKEEQIEVESPAENE